MPGLLTSIIVPALVADRERNTQICDDIAAAIRDGRNCLVLTGRTDHVDRLAGALKARGGEPVTLYRGLKPKERLAALDRLASAPAGGSPLLVIATDRYIGDGFDCLSLDTVFLTYPLSSESPIIQYVGRILREHPGKTDAIVHDYADTKVPMLARMHGKRLTAYRRLGFTTGLVQPRLPGPHDHPLNFAQESAVAQPRRPEEPPLPDVIPGDTSVTYSVPAPGQVRAWARTAGLDVPPRGRIAADVLAAYRVAHPTQPEGGR